MPSPPQLDSDDSYDERLATVLAEVADSVQRGETVELERVCGEHPDLADELRQLWGTMLVAAAAGDSARRESEGGEPTTPVRRQHDSGSLPCRKGDYELLEELGRGGMGVVYRARQLSLGREVAVKMILGGDAAGPSGRKRFLAEAESAARLDHPHIVPVFDVGEFDGQPYFSMKLIEGCTLSQRLERGPLAPRETAALLAQVARAVDAAHRQGVLHRDLKPSNILIDEQGTAHVTDFGLAKRVSEPGSLTRSGAVLGTPAYMAPEQAAGTRGVLGPATDVYSLGAILYHLITGRPPFSGGSPVDVVLKVLGEEPPPPRTLNPRVDRDLEMISLHCLQKPPDLRYPSAAALADDLEAYLKDESVAARSGRLGQVVARMFRETHHAPVLENWGLLWMWHSLVLLVVSLLTHFMQLYGDEHRLHYVVIWNVALWVWAAVFWALRRRAGPVMFVERQIAHVWAGSMLVVAGLFPLEYYLGLPVLALSPVLALVNSSVFLVKASILSGAFYVQAAVLLLAAVPMALFPRASHLIFGVVSAASFFFPGLKYYRRTLQERRAVRSESEE